MRKLITMLALLSFLGLNLSSCDTEDFKSNKELFDIEDINVSINEFEKELNKKILGEEYEGLYNKPNPYINPYDDKSSEFILFLNEIKRMLMNQEENNEVESFIENRLVDFESYNISETSDFDLMEEVLSSLENTKRNYDENMERYIIESYEVFVSEKISENSSTYHDLMRILSLQKHIYNAFVELDSNNSNDNRTTTSKWKCGHRDCWDCCMWRTYKEYNWVDIVEMALTPFGPAGDVAWRSASCAWIAGDKRK